MKKMLGFIILGMVAAGMVYAAVLAYGWKITLIGLATTVAIYLACYLITDGE